MSAPKQADAAVVTMDSTPSVVTPTAPLVGVASTDDFVYASGGSGTDIYDKPLTATSSLSGGFSTSGNTIDVGLWDNNLATLDSSGVVRKYNNLGDLISSVNISGSNIVGYSDGHVLVQNQDTNVFKKYQVDFNSATLGLQVGQSFTYHYTPTGFASALIENPFTGQSQREFFMTGTGENSIESLFLHNSSVYHISNGDISQIYSVQTSSVNQIASVLRSKSV